MYDIRTERILQQLSEEWGRRLLYYFLRQRSVQVALRDRRPAGSVMVFLFRVTNPSDITDLLRLDQPVAMTLGVPSVRLGRDLGYFVVEVPLPTELRQTVAFREVVSAPGAGLSVPIGVSAMGRPVSLDLSQPESPHVMVAGTTGCGKTVALRTLLLQAALRNRPEHVGMILLDVKRSSLAPFARLPHLMHPVVHDVDEMLAILQWAVEEMERRAGQPSQRRILLVIDELANMVLQTGGADGMAAQRLARIAAMGREFGISLVAGTQQIKAEVIGSMVRANITTRLIGAVENAQQSALVANGPDVRAHALLGRGDFIRVSGGGQNMIRFQVAMPGDEDFDRLPVAASIPQLTLPEPVDEGAAELDIDPALVARWLRMQADNQPSGIHAFREALAHENLRLGTTRATRHVTFGRALVSEIGTQGMRLEVNFGETSKRMRDLGGGGGGGGGSDPHRRHGDELESGQHRRGD